MEKTVEFKELLDDDPIVGAVVDMNVSFDHARGAVEIIINGNFHSFTIGEMDERAPDEIVAMLSWVGTEIITATVEGRDQVLDDRVAKLESRLGLLEQAWDLVFPETVPKGELLV